MKRKLLAFVLAVCMVLGMIPVVSAVESAATSGLCGPDLRWEYDPTTATLTISGSGEMDIAYEYTSREPPPWRPFLNSMEQLIVEEGVVSIDEDAFYRAYTLSQISLPDSLISIGENAFRECSSLQQIELPDQLQYIGPRAFQETSLAHVSIPREMTEIQAYTFHLCPSLTSVELHDGITIIWQNAFWGCDRLEELELPDGLVSIGPFAFSECVSLNSIRIPGSVEEIGSNAFSYCTGLDSVIVEPGVRIIGEYAFYGCGAIEEMELSEGLVELQQYALGCGLTRIVIPSTVLTFGKDVIGGADEIVFTGRAPAFDPEAFLELTTDVYYPQNYSTWTEDVLQQYGGNITWIPYDNDQPEPDAHQHEYKMYVNQPNCESWGSTYYICYCGARKEGEEIPPLGHSYGEWFVTQQATEDSDGRKERTCSVCGWTEEQKIPMYKNPFTDVKASDYFYEPVLWAVDNNITSGVSATRFAPNDPCTRAQVVTFLWRAAGEPQPTSTKNPFTDVKASAYYYDAVLWAVEEGITTGLSATSFGPNSPCTRGQVVTFLHRAAGETEPESTRNPFTDVKETGFYYDAVLWAVEKGITTGTSATKFSPNQTCTRGQVVTFLYRAN